MIPLEPRPQFLVVVYFTVYDDTNGFVFIEYGLMATFKIDDAQTPMSKRHVVVAKQAFVIWAGYRFSVGKTSYASFPLPAPELFSGIDEVKAHDMAGLEVMGRNPVDHELEELGVSGVVLDEQNLDGFSVHAEAPEERVQRTATKFEESPFWRL